MYLCLIFIFCDIDVSVQAGYFMGCPSSRATASTRFSPVKHFCPDYYVGDLLAFSVPLIGKHDDSFVLLLGDVNSDGVVTAVAGRFLHCKGTCSF